jgi:hypothetical protein
MWCYNLKPSNTVRHLQFYNHISLVKQDTYVSQKVCRCAFIMLSYKFLRITMILQLQILLYGFQFLFFYFSEEKESTESAYGIWGLKSSFRCSGMFLCSLVDKYHIFQIKYTASIFRCWSHFTSTYLPNYMASYPTRQKSEKLNNFHRYITMQNCITLSWICQYFSILEAFIDTDDIMWLKSMKVGQVSNNMMLILSFMNTDQLVPIILVAEINTSDTHLQLTERFSLEC